MKGGFYALPADQHPDYRVPCAACGGDGVTGERFEMPVGDAGVVLVVDVICDACTGCGNGDPEHLGCAVAAHAYPDDEDEDGDGPGDGAVACYSCGSGRGWNAVQSFTSGDDPVMVVLRVPCGCAEDRLVPVAP